MPESSGAVWVRVPVDGPDRLATALRERLEDDRRRRGRRFGDDPWGVLAFDPVAHAFALVDRWGKSDGAPRWLGKLHEVATYAELSATFEEVLAFFELEGGSEMGEWAHWRGGALVRALAWSGSEWSSVTGEPQPWEAWLFASDRRDRALAAAREDGDPEEAVRGAFDAGRVVQGGRWPRPGRRASPASAMSSVHRAPWHEFQPWPLRDEMLRLLEAEIEAKLEAEGEARLEEEESP